MGGSPVDGKTGDSSGSPSSDMRTRRFVLYRKKLWPLRYDVWPFAILVAACAFLVFSDLASRPDVFPDSSEAPVSLPDPTGAPTGDLGASDRREDRHAVLKGNLESQLDGQVSENAETLPPVGSDAPEVFGETSTSSTTEAPKRIEELFPTLAWLFSSVYFLYCLLFVFLGGLLHLSTHWFVSLDCLVSYTAVSSVGDTTSVLVIPPSGRPLESRTLCPLVRRPEQIFFFYRKKKFMFVSETGTFEPLRFPKSRPLSEYLQWRGLEAAAAPSSSVQTRPAPSLSSSISSMSSASNSDPQLPFAGKALSPSWDPATDVSVPTVQAKYGSNDYDMPIPTFQELLKEHAVSPFFVFQMCCVFLWLIDEYWQYSLLTLVMLVLLECQMVKKRLRDFQQLRAMRIPPRTVHVFRSGSWIPLRSDCLLPGDVFAITGSTNPDEAVCPVDALLLQGSAVVNEATLTGESVPQTKVALEKDEVDGEQTESDREGKEGDLCLDMELRNKQNIVFAGTAVILHRNDQSSFARTRVPEKACVGYVLRTAFSTTQGKLVRTILFCHGRVTVASREAWLFLGLLLVLALCASAYVLCEGIQNAERSRFKLFLSCSHIVMAVVPAEFPITLSLAVTMALLFLFTQQIFCTEPFRVPLAGQVDVCAFDKTGTLTSDSMRVKGVYGVRTSEGKAASSRPGERAGDEEETLVTQILPFETVAVMGACQALAVVDGQLLGDPLEKASFNAVGWTLTSPDSVVSAPRPWPLPTSSTLQQDRVTVLRRFPFSSALQRMTVVARVEGARMPWYGAFASPEKVEEFRGTLKASSSSGGYADFVASKGSPEKIKQFLKEVPAFYDELYTGFCLKGYRVLALAYKELEPGASHSQRSDLEKNLFFAGFLVVTCPIKKGTKADIDVVCRAGHRAIMITGDSPLTACQVAVDVGIFRENSPHEGESTENEAERDEQETHSISRPILILKCDRQKRSAAPAEERTSKPDAFGNHLRQRHTQSSVPRTESPAAPGSRGPALEDFFWERRDRQQTFPLLAFLLAADSSEQRKNPAPDESLAPPRWTGLAQLSADFHLCLTGPVISALLEVFGAESVSEQVAVLGPLLPFVGVFARMSPQQKELILVALKAAGFTTLMCGDGTNDVGALKAAHVGVSLLCQAAHADAPRGGCSRQAWSGKTVKDSSLKMEKDPRRRGHGSASGAPRGETLSAAHKKELERRMEEMWEHLDDGPPLVRLGDASIASPFTFKGDLIRCVPLILRSGRATLVTVIMMYKLMALNSTITAFALSVLTLDGVKLGDLQTTLENLLCTLLTLMISKTRPSLEMGSCRPVASIFHPLVFLSLVLQAGLHVYTLYAAWDLAKAFRAPDYKPNLDGHFEPNLVNSVVFLLIASMHASTFLSNYEGAPFMVPLTENKPLVLTLGFLVSTLLTLVFELVPSLNETLSLVPFPTREFKVKIIGLVFLDLVGAWLVAWSLRKVTWWWAQRAARRARRL
ncbi:P-type ATPase of unknown pump specificity (type V) protein [Toxoplasma gondii ARI]|uniref:P-type ATPase A domain-containing protein n=1 Tax=Toxoplasma gondii ARI TaxID=1074872 RepID=A0A139XK75_TOXGO|nr:P-type ATPase of unknown pump specificity (type V) protein [Toxoplasma gondii ARI]